MDLNITHPHSLNRDEVFKVLQTGPSGLTQIEADRRLSIYGSNQLKTAAAPSLLFLFIRQFINPLIYILLIIGVISILLGHFSDAGFIFGILILNAIIGTLQEYNAEKGAIALRHVTPSKATVRRDGENFEIDSKNLVLGDLIYLESGVKVPADIRLFQTQSLQVDESLLTGESLPVFKEHDSIESPEALLSDRSNMAFAGTLVTKGRGEGIVVATGNSTILGQIADTVLQRIPTKTPLVIRMERFTKGIAISLCFIVLLLGLFLILQGEPWIDVLFLSAALGVAAIPEGLPVALTVALAIAARRMSHKQVLVRNLSSVEALGSCTYIGTDKTGTLTINELTAQTLVFPHLDRIRITGTGIKPEGQFITTHLNTADNVISSLIQRISETVVLCNEAILSIRDENWVGHGDSVDLALLVMAHKAGVISGKTLSQYILISEIPFESEHRYSATLHQSSNHFVISVKGALETLLPMCNQMATPKGDLPIHPSEIENSALKLAEEGYRVIAVATCAIDEKITEPFSSKHLKNLTFLGFIGLIDPLRPEAKAAVKDCQSAGVKVAMITGDHPATALAIARELELASTLEEVITGSMLRSAHTSTAMDELIRKGRVFARVEPLQKLEIVQSLIRQHHFVAVTGDGANDAPALKAAHVGVAMGKSGTDVARETADLIITDDRFSSLIAGIKEGRIAYSNVRKVIYVLISTSAAEIILFILSTIAQFPIPLTAIQLLWLNLVTDGIQVIALAFEPAEGNELYQPPRSPKEPIFDKLMLERIIISALIMGLSTFFVYADLNSKHTSSLDSRNQLLFLMVLFENAMIINARSERISTFALSPMRNLFLLFATLGALAIHIISMYIPPLAKILGVYPLVMGDWIKYLFIVPIVIIAIEIHKKIIPKLQR